MLLDPPPPGHAAVATGRLTWDVIVHGGEMRGQAGGTPGNVLAILASLGWPASALGRVGDDDPGRRLVADLGRWGVDCSRLEQGGRTPVVVHQVTAAGHSFDDRCPRCGAALPGHEPPPALPPPPPPVTAFVFDEDSPATLDAARACRRAGATVLWEPNYVGPEVDFDGAAAAADVLKVSAQTVPDLGREAAVPFLIITDGAAGLSYRRRAWHRMAAFRVGLTRDAAGCGDWATAGYLHGKAHGADDRDALRLGTALAAWNAAFVGSRGGMYAVDRATFREQVTAILAGEVFDPGREPAFVEAGAFCDSCPASLRREPGE